MSIECEANDHSNDQRSIPGHCEEDLVVATKYSSQCPVIPAKTSAVTCKLDPRGVVRAKTSAYHTPGIKFAPLGSSSHVTTDVLAGTTPLGSSSHVTTDVLAGTTPLGSRSKVTMDSSIFTDLCCVCFSSFEEDEGTGREWLQCICSRWIHEDCVVPNPNGENKLCPIC